MPTAPQEEGQGSAGVYLWDAGSQEGGRVLGQRQVVHHAVRHLREQVTGPPVSVQLLQQVRDQVVPLPALLDQRSQLGLKGWERDTAWWVPGHRAATGAGASRPPLRLLAPP